MTLLIVIPTLNEARHIAGVIGSVLADPLAGSSLIVVADGGSTDGTREIVAGLAEAHGNVRLLDNPARIQAAGVNLAVARFGADRELLIRLDAHAGYPPRYVSALVEAANRTGADSVVVPMKAVGEACFQSAVAAAQNSRLGTGGAAHRMGVRSDWVDHGHHALMRLSAFTAVGGYSTDLATNEDADLDTRLLASGARIWLSVEQQIDYYPRTTAGALWRQYVRFGFGRATTLRRHGQRPRLRQLLPICIAPAVGAAVLACVILQGFAVPSDAFRLVALLLAAPAGAWSVGCLIYGLALGVRQNSPCAAAAGIPAMIMHLAWSCGFWFNRIGGRL